uniref:Zinc finger protein 300 n=2 Tax=Culex pipiens TaxID=7175 RepID=A0A8D8P3M2_CULPI
MESSSKTPNCTPLTADIAHFCRFCLTRAPALVPIQSTVKDVPIPKMFVLLTGVTIDLNDSYPQKACSECCGKLETAYNVRQSFLDNVFKLPDFLKSRKGKVGSESEAEDDIGIKNEPWESSEEASSKDGSSSEFEYVAVEEPPKKRKITKAISLPKEKTVSKNPRQIYTQSSDETKQYTCKYAGCEYVTADYFKYHHHKKSRHERNFECSICQKRFPKQIQLSNHANSHLDKSERPFACDQCDRKFTSKTRLIAHGRIHTGEKPYLCTECGESFHSSAFLANHALKHSKPQHKCQHCSKEFRYKGDFVKHLRLHEENEWQCSF